MQIPARKDYIDHYAIPKNQEQTVTNLKLLFETSLTSSIDGRVAAFESVSA